MKESYHVWQTEEWTQKEPYKKRKKKKNLTLPKKNLRDFKIICLKEKKGYCIILSIILKVAHL